ncbi:hypothetical protein ACFWV1_19015 [Streptomyces sp. NPDC058700]
MVHRGGGWLVCCNDE